MTCRQKLNELRLERARGNPEPSTKGHTGEPPHA
jgi:hypothetical protein